MTHTLIALALQAIIAIPSDNWWAGAAALILCSHQNTAGNGTNAELFLIRYGNDGNNFSALSLGRSVGTDTNTYTFTVDADGFLQITSGAGNARYMVVSNMRGYEYMF